MKKITISGLMLSVIAFHGYANASKKVKKPNIIVILADDLGYSDLSCYGSEIQTPNLDYLASRGVRFSQFYNTSRSCPSRAALLTGLYNHNAGIGAMTTDEHQPGYRGHITTNTVTLAEVLKTAGYNTAMVGKWHVSNTIEQKNAKAQLNWLNHQESHPLFSPLEQYPTSRGFDKYFGTIWGVVDFFDPFSLVNGNKPVEKVPEGYYHTDAINDTAVSYIVKMSGDKKPFFMYVAHNAPHWPLMALPEDIKKYQDTYKAGWDAIRKARYSKMAKLGIIDSTKCSLSERWNKDLTWENNPDKEWDAMAMAVHAAMIDRMDQGIGRIIKTLQDTKELDNTIIIFLSDNGASPEMCNFYGPGFDRPSQTRSGETISYARDKKTFPGPQNTYFSIGPRWANVANTPFKLAKAESYEGGVRTSFIAFWPEGISLKPGSICQFEGHVIDIMPTFVELAGASYPRKYQGNEISPMQGVSLVSVLKGEKQKEHGALCNEHLGARSINYKGWKLVSTAKDTTWHLYHLSEDQAEINDLAKAFPDKVAELSIMWQQWAEKNKVLPKPKRK